MPINAIHNAFEIVVSNCKFVQDNDVFTVSYSGDDSSASDINLRSIAEKACTKSTNQCTFEM